MVSLICSRAGRSTAAAVTLDTVADESRKKMADGVTRSPARLCSRDGKICYYRRLEYAFFAFVPCFLLVISYPALSRYVYLLRAPSSVQQSSSVTTLISKYVFYSTCYFFLVSFVSCLISEFLCFSSFSNFFL